MANPASLPKSADERANQNPNTLVMDRDSKKPDLHVRYGPQDSRDRTRDDLPGDTARIVLQEIKGAIAGPAYRLRVFEYDPEPPKPLAQQYDDMGVTAPAACDPDRGIGRNSVFRGPDAYQDALTAFIRELPRSPHGRIVMDEAAGEGV